MCSKGFKLSDLDQEKVSQVIKGEKGRAVSRAIVLKMKDRNHSNIDAGDIAGVSPRTVINICQNYLNSGLEAALYDDPRPGRAPKFDDRIKAQVVALVCSDPPEGFDRWTIDLLQEKVEEIGIVEKISKESVRLILREHDLKPWQYQMWCVPEITEEYIKRMEGVLDLYARDYDGKEPVLCIDEKAVMLFGEKRDPIPFGPGKPTRLDYEYSRNGSVNVFFAVEPLKGIFYTKVTKTKKKKDFAEFLVELYEKYKYSKKIHLVMDNYCTHFKSSLIEALGKKKGNKVWSKFEVHYTPKHASWLNQAEIAIGMYSRQCLGKMRVDNIKFLKTRTESWTRIINEKSLTLKWRFTKKDAREKFSYR